MAIPDWPEGERPREKLLAHSPQALSDAELLALFLRVGIRGKSAVDLAREMIQHFGSLTRLCAASVQEFQSLPGMGPAKYAQLQAVMELARRVLAEQCRDGPLLNSPQKVRDWLRLKLGSLPYEVFVLLLLDTRNHLIKDVELARGTLDRACIYPREVIKKVIDYNAAAVILLHNHPSGNAKPSQDDHQTTRTLQQALAHIDVRVLDHLIVTAHAHPFSFSERGML